MIVQVCAALAERSLAFCRIIIDARLQNHAITLQSCEDDTARVIRQIPLCCPTIRERVYLHVGICLDCAKTTQDARSEGLSQAVQWYINAPRKRILIFL